MQWFWTIILNVFKIFFKNITLIIIIKSRRLNDMLLFFVLYSRKPIYEKKNNLFQLFQVYNLCSISNTLHNKIRIHCMQLLNIFSISIYYIFWWKNKHIVNPEYLDKSKNIFIYCIKILIYSLLLNCLKSYVCKYLSINGFKYTTNSWVELLNAIVA